MTRILKSFEFSRTFGLEKITTTKNPALVSGVQVFEWRQAVRVSVQASQASHAFDSRVTPVTPVKSQEMSVLSELCAVCAEQAEQKDLPSVPSSAPGNPVNVTVVFYQNESFSSK